MLQQKKKRLNLKGMALHLAAILLIAAAGLWIWRGICHKTPGSGVKLPDYVTADLLTLNPYSRPGTDLTKIDGIVIHYVGNPGTTANANRNYFESLKDGVEDTYASAHFVVGLDGEVVQCIPLSEWSYASNTRNEDTISIEVCHPDDTGEFSDVTYDRVVELTAWLLQTFQLDTQDVMRHYDISGKICPKYFVDCEDAWGQFLADVEEARGILDT